MKCTLVFLLLFTIIAFGQQKKLGVCESEIVELTLAYEYGGQGQLDDMLFESPSLVVYNQDNITIKNYENGVYLFYSEDTNLQKLQDCLPDLTYKTVSEFEDPFYAFDTKIITYKNKAFAGRGTTMLGDQPTTWAYHEFTYKILKVKFERTYIGIEKRTLINIDRESTSDEEILTIDCPVYIMTKIIAISSVE